MVLSRNFLAVTLADFFVRTAYQLGKLLPLPLLAVQLGVGEAYLGLIVSISTLTGLLLKPIFGGLSDRWGRYGWLLLGTLWFIGIPFLYTFVENPEELFALRLIHGLATAIYGPVTLAYIAELSENRVAERLGWFSMARGLSYIIAPLLGGWLLTGLPPQEVFTYSGYIAAIALVPVLLLSLAPRLQPPCDEQERLPLLKDLGNKLYSGVRSLPVWLAGGIEALLYFGLYTVKVFLPVYALQQGIPIFWVGTFFAVQQAVHLLLNPLGGRLGDCIGYGKMLCSGFLLLSFAMLAFPWAIDVERLMLLAVLMGSISAFIIPSALAWVVHHNPSSQALGTKMGLVGSLKNTGKIIGPVAVGALIQWFGFAHSFYVLFVIFLIITFSLIIWECKTRPMGTM